MVALSVLSGPGRGSPSAGLSLTLRPVSPKSQFRSSPKSHVCVPSPLSSEKSLRHSTLDLPELSPNPACSAHLAARGYLGAIPGFLFLNLRVQSTQSQVLCVPVPCCPLRPGAQFLSVAAASAQAAGLSPRPPCKPSAFAVAAVAELVASNGTSVSPARSAGHSSNTGLPGRASGLWQNRVPPGRSRRKRSLPRSGFHFSERDPFPRGCLRLLLRPLVMTLDPARLPSTVSPSRGP